MNETWLARWISGQIRMHEQQIASLRAMQLDLEPCLKWEDAVTTTATITAKEHVDRQSPIAYEGSIQAIGQTINELGETIGKAQEYDHYRTGLKAADILDLARRVGKGAT